MRAVMLFCLLLSLTGCAKTMAFSKAGATQTQFMQDRYACIQQSTVTNVEGRSYEGTGSVSTSLAVGQGVFVSCMSLKGYQLDENGTLLPPAGGEVRMVN
jgi:hypothetical protein